MNIFIGMSMFWIAIFPIAFSIGFLGAFACLLSELHKKDNPENKYKNEKDWW